MRRALVILGVLLVTVLGALFTLPAMIDWDTYRGTIEEEASRLAGREVRIGGRIVVRLLPAPYIHIERLRVADTAAAIGEPLFRAEAMTVRLALSPLLAGAIEARRVELSSPVLNLVLDENGSGNWASLASSSAASSAEGRSSRFSFSDIQLEEGSLVVRDPQGNIKSHLGSIAGTISATALEGPYRVALNYIPRPKAPARKAVDQDVRELRLSTARQDRDGSVRFKASVRVPARQQSWAVDGTAHDLLGAVSVRGALTARTAYMPPAENGARARAPRSPVMVEVKSSLKADSTSAELADLTLTLDADDKPQLAQGAAKFTWRQESTAEIFINARWLDIDRIIGTAQETTATQVLARLVASLETALPATDRLSTLVLLDQATLNGDVISGLKVDLQKSTPRAYELRELSGNLPGSARLVLSGTLIPDAADTQFAGPLTLRGASFNRFVAWAGRGQEPPEIARDGAFALDAHLTIGPQRIAGEAIRLELPGGRLSGDAMWQRPTADGAAKARSGPALSLSLDGPAFDIGALLPREPRPGALLQTLVASLLEPGTSGDAGSKDTALSGLQSAAIKLRFGRLATQAAAYHDVDAELSWDGRGWQVPKLKARSAAGWTIELEGNLASADDTGPAGALAGVIIAPEPEAFTDFLRWLDVPTSSSTVEVLLAPQRLTHLTPLRLAGRLDLSPRAEPGVTRLTLDGALGRSQIAATVTAPERMADLLAQPLEINLSSSSADIATLVAQLAPSWAAPPSPAPGPPARLTLSAIGSFGRGFDLLAALDSPSARAELRGQLDTTSSLPGLKASLDLAAEDLATLGAATALGRSPSVASVPLSGRLGLDLSERSLKITSETLALAGARLNGQLALDFSKPSIQLQGTLGTSRLVLSRALMPILDEHLLPPPDERSEMAPWSEAPFDLSRLDSLEGTIAIAADELVLAEGISLREARLESLIKPGHLELRLVEAPVLNGKASARLSLAKAPAGAVLKGSLRLESVDLQKAVPEGTTPPLAGRAHVTMDVQGAALTPRGLMASLNGSGEVRLTEAALSKLSPTAVLEASEQVFAPGGSLAPGHLEAMIRERLASEQIALGRRRIALNVSDGHVRTAPIVAESTAGRVTGTTLVDLENLRIDSEWKLDGVSLAARPGSTARNPLPAVSVIWAGPLAQLANLEPQVHVDALERELSVRRMEGEVDELERLRRQDEDRARQEAERQRALEAERVRELERMREAERARQSTSAPAGSDPSAWQPTTSGPPASGTTDGQTSNPAATPGERSSQDAPSAAPSTPPRRRAPPKQQPFNPFSLLWGN